MAPGFGPVNRWRADGKAPDRRSEDRRFSLKIGNSLFLTDR